LDNDKFSYEKLKAIFEFRTLSIAGFSPNIKKCVHCGTSENPGYLNLNDGVLLCKNCGNGLKNLIPINQTIIDAIYYISNIDMKHLYSFILSDEAINYLSIVGERYLETQSAHSYTTLEYLKKVINLT
ncbi:MAG: DNA repair protein RecO C-terminal domain-containing protein, partial [Oscillospiraceae bacterium]